MVLYSPQEYFSFGELLLVEKGASVQSICVLCTGTTMGCSYRGRLSISIYVFMYGFMLAVSILQKKKIINWK